MRKITSTLYFELDFAFIYQNFVEFKKICKTYLMKEFESKLSQTILYYKLINE